MHKTSLLRFLVVLLAFSFGYGHAQSGVNENDINIDSILRQQITSYNIINELF